MHKKISMHHHYYTTYTLPSGSLDGSLVLNLANWNNPDGIIIQLSILLCLFDRFNSLIIAYITFTDLRFLLQGYIPRIL